MSKLTVKQEKFVRAYVESGNATQAYMKAYSTKNMKQATINNNAYMLLNRSDIKASVKKLKHELSKKDIITKEEMLKTYAEMYRANPIDFVTVKSEDKTEVDKEGNVLSTEYSQVVLVKNLEELTEAQQKCIKSIKPTRNGVEIELYPKTDVGDRIAKMLGFNEAEKLDVKSELTGDKHTDVIDILKAAEKLKGK